MITDIYNLDNIQKVYRYLEYTTLANRKDKAVLNKALDKVRLGKAFTETEIKEVGDLFSLYNGTTV